MATRAVKTEGRKDGRTDGPPTPSGNVPSFRPTSYRGVFPNSRKVYLEGPHGIRVPMREIALSGGEPPLRVYDTSGPEGCDVRGGLPALRAGWIREREVEKAERRNGGQAVGSPTTPSALPPFRPSVLRGRSPITQLAYARCGEITPAMEFVALREGLPADFVRSEVARHRAITPANINHPEL